jgi:hypothetical protein
VGTVGRIARTRTDEMLKMIASIDNFDGNDKIVAALHYPQFCVPCEQNKCDQSFQIVSLNRHNCEYSLQAKRSAERSTPLDLSPQL